MIGAIVGDIAGSRFEFHNRNEIRAKAMTFLTQRLADVLGRFEIVFCQEGKMNVLKKDDDLTDLVICRGSLQKWNRLTSTL